MTAEAVLIKLKQIAEFDLDDLCSKKEANKELEPLKMIYIEMLEVIQMWDRAKYIGLDYDIEKRYLDNDVV